ncbi:hypothetical protein BDQ17DRAFT_1382494 [Cyathus striatus]|nr:hypothetical protein BDQ17DRAFT_1382494 [Cyathus striatus]
MPPTTLDQLKSLLRQNLRVTLNDGRILLGMFCAQTSSLILLSPMLRNTYNEAKNNMQILGRLCALEFVVKIELSFHHNIHMIGGGRDSGYGALYL